MVPSYPVRLVDDLCKAILCIHPSGRFIEPAQSAPVCGEWVDLRVVGHRVVFVLSMQQRGLQSSCQQAGWSC